jgi:hypothetical protein
MVGFDASKLIKHETKGKEYNGREAIALRSRTLNEPFLCKKTDPCLLSEKNSGDAIRIYEGNDVRTCTKKRLGKKD